MTTSNMILIAVAVLVVLAVAVVVGVVLNRRRRISLAQRDEKQQEAVQGGGYRTDSGISLSSGGAPATAPPEHPVVDRTETEGQPAVGDDAAVPRDTERRGIVDVPLPGVEPGELEAETDVPREEPAAGPTGKAGTVDAPGTTDTAPPAERVEPAEQAEPVEQAEPTGETGTVEEAGTTEAPAQQADSTTTTPTDRSETVAPPEEYMTPLIGGS